MEGAHLRRDLFLLAFCVPLVLLLVFLLPESAKDSLALHTDAPNVVSLFTAHFVHEDVGHFLGNVASYLAFAIPACLLGFLAGRVRELRLAVVLIFILVPPSSSALCLLTPGARFLGFSGIVAAFWGLLPYFSLSYFKKRCNWEFGILSLLNLVLLFDAAVLSGLYFELAPYHLVLVVSATRTKW